MSDKTSKLNSSSFVIPEEGKIDKSLFSGTPWKILISNLANAKESEEYQSLIALERAFADLDSSSELFRTNVSNGLIDWNVTLLDNFRNVAYWLQHRPAITKQIRFIGDRSFGKSTFAKRFATRYSARPHLDMDPLVVFCWCVDNDMPLTLKLGDAARGLHVKNNRGEEKKFVWGWHIKDSESEIAPILYNLIQTIVEVVAGNTHVTLPPETLRIDALIVPNYHEYVKANQIRERFIIRDSVDYKPKPPLSYADMCRRIYELALWSDRYVDFTIPIPNTFREKDMSRALTYLAHISNSLDIIGQNRPDYSEQEREETRGQK